MNLAVRCLLFGMLLASLVPASAQNYPQKPIQIVVAFPPGGSVDTVARLLASKLSSAFGVPVIVDNKPGAGSVIGTSYVAKAEPTGYTLLLTDVPFAINPSVLKNVPYDPIRDFAPVVMVGTSPQFLYSRPGRFAGASGLIAEAKAKPGSISLASSGNGTTSHLLAEMLALGAGVKLLHVPYKGGAPAMLDVIGGRVDAIFQTPATGAQHVNAGKLEVLAVTSTGRLPAFPNVPTFVELGLPELVVEHWWGVLAPANVSPQIVQQLYVEIAKAVALPDVRERFAALSIDPKSSAPAEFRRMIEAEVRRWSKVAKEANVTAN